MGEPKIVFVVKIRLDPKKDFREIETHSRKLTLKEAEARVDEWYASLGNLRLKAKPEATIEAVSMPHMANCKECTAPQFQGDIVFFSQQNVYCHKCAYEVNTGEGHFNILGEPL